MREYNIEILAPAWRELEEIADMHLSLVGAKSAEKITSKILDTIDNLKTSPFIGQVIEDKMLFNDGYRRIICGKYLCFYKVIGETVFVYHIIDGRRNYPKLLAELK